MPSADLQNQMSVEIQTFSLLNGAAKRKESISTKGNSDKKLATSNSLFLTVHHRSEGAEVTQYNLQHTQRKNLECHNYMTSSLCIL